MDGAARVAAESPLRFYERLTTDESIRLLYLCCLAVWPVFIQGQTSCLTGPAAVAKRPRVFQLDAAELHRIKVAARTDVGAKAIIEATVRAADNAMHEGPFSVMQKAVTPPSGDKHDHMSQVPYFWADPTKPNGLPYIRRDGERNPELKKISDHDNLGRLGEDTRLLGACLLLHWGTGVRCTCRAPAADVGHQSRAHPTRDNETVTNGAPTLCSSHP